MMHGDDDAPRRGGQDLAGDMAKPTPTPDAAPSKLSHVQSFAWELSCGVCYKALAPQELEREARVRVCRCGEVARWHARCIKFGLQATRPRDGHQKAADLRAAGSLRPGREVEVVEATSRRSVPWRRSRRRVRWSTSS